MLDNRIIGNDIKFDLYDFQKECQMWGAEVLQSHTCLLICDDQGLGKSIEALAVAQVLPDVKRILVICPTFATDEWARIIEQGTDYSYCIVDDERDLKNRVFITIIGYDRYRISNEVIDKSKFDLAIIDEFQFIKNKDAKQTQAVVSHRFKYVIMVSGTPIMNQPAEFWSSLNYCFPKQFGTYEDFFNRYTKTAIRSFWIHTRTGRHFRKMVRIPVGVKNIGELKSRLNNIMIRRLKKDVFKELPDKVRQQYSIKLGVRQKAIYDSAKSGLLRLIRGRQINLNDARARFGHLRQLCCAAVDDRGIISSKMDLMKQILRPIIENGNKVFIATPYIKMAEYAAREFQQYGSVCVTSKTDAEHIALARKRFQEERSPMVYVGTIGKHQGAITLTAASYVVFFGKDLVPNRNLQVEDRLHRIGQKSSVTVINLVAKDTVDERIEELLANKNEWVGSVMNIRGVTRLRISDIKRLIS